MEFKENQICPICFCNMLMIYGYSWDYDRLVCGDKDCDYEVEFESSTYMDDF